MKEVVIGKGKIHGKGVFANRSFKKGEIVINYSLKQLSKDEFNNRLKKERDSIHIHSKKFIFIHLLRGMLITPLTPILYKT